MMTNLNVKNNMDIETLTKKFLLVAMGIVTFILLIAEGKTFAQTVEAKLIALVLFILTGYLFARWKKDLLK